ncbi:putative mitochondrial N5-glutamine methyltransferase [Dipodascopsis tothii]|uniref:putative mitochondrial N5-glutamine methyltransferase n=1 Tax=Dipodascopsis tothii TaxID=44089 RepID=UPI0034CED953
MLTQHAYKEHRAQIFDMARQAYLRRMAPYVRPRAAAARELGWIIDEAAGKGLRGPALHRRVLRDATLRGQGVPLQYLLGNQPFGDLDVLCRPGVLIPRWETEEWTLRLAQATRENVPDPGALRVLDLCTGTGCVGLLLAHELGAAVRGVDVSPKAVGLARRNAAHNGLDVAFARADIFDDSPALHGPADLVVANPPYISRAGLRQAEPSVRRFEPMLALHGGVEFFSRIFALADAAGAHGVVAELSDDAQMREIWATVNADRAWAGGALRDAAGRTRCVVAYRDWSWLSALVDERY